MNKNNFGQRVINMGFPKWAALLVGANSILIYYAVKSNASEKAQVEMAVSRSLSRFTGSVAQCTIPQFMRQSLFKAYGSMYDVQYDDMIQPDLSQYASFQEFFTREVKPRSFDKKVQSLTSPADSRVLSFTEIKEDETLLIKNINYKLGHFLSGQANYKANLAEMRKRDNTKLYSIIFYLAPGDYHRYHSPSDMVVKTRNHVCGYLAPVKIDYISKQAGVYESNERVGIFGTYKFGFMGLMFVGAMNVGSMTLGIEQILFIQDFTSNRSEVDQLYNYKTYSQPINVEKGSTVVMIFEAKDVRWKVEPNQKVRWGETFAEILE